MTQCEYEDKKGNKWPVPISYAFQTKTTSAVTGHSQLSKIDQKILKLMFGQLLNLMFGTWGLKPIFPKQVWPKILF